jgi:undecaprenyl-diphosphatase
MLYLVIAALLQGVLEWLPVSSEGIITLILSFFGYSFKDGINIALFLHLGTLMASLTFFKEEIFSFFQLKRKKLLRFVILSGVITSIVGLPIYLILQEINFNNKLGQLLIGLSLLVTGFLQLKRQKQGSKSIEQVGNKDAVLTGLAQALAVLPGISRSGTTTIILNLRGFNIHNALKLSFLVGIIPIFGAQLVTGIKEGFFLNEKYLLLTLISFVVGRISISYFLKIAKKINFGWFCLLFGLLNILLTFLI